MKQDDEQYTNLLERVKALFIDSLVLVFSMVIFTQIFSAFENVPDFVRISAAVLIFVLYSPLCVSFWGGTLGHHLVGIRVKNEKDESENITLLMAVLRFAIKASLGWISLLTITGNKKSV